MQSTTLGTGDPGMRLFPGPGGLIVFRVHRPRKQTTETRTKGQAEWANLYVKKSASSQVAL